MKCLLHIGTEKTGTTSLQGFLTHYAEDLKQHGVYYSACLGRPNNRHLATMALGWENQDESFSLNGLNNEEAYAAYCARLRAELADEVAHLRAEAGPEALYVISNEHLQSRLIHPDMVALVQNILAPLFDEIEVVCFLRPQADLALSRLTTRARTGNPVLPKHFQTDGVYYDFLALYKRWHSAFGNVTIVPYKRNRNTVHYFMERFELAPDHFPPRPRINTKLDIRTISLLGVAGPMTKDGKRNPNRKIYVNDFPCETPLSVDRASAQAEQDRHEENNGALCELVPDLSPDDLRIDPQRYPETGNINSLADPSIDPGWAGQLIQRFNVELAMERCEKYILRARNAKLTKTRQDAAKFLRNAEHQLENARLGDLEATQKRIGFLEKQIAQLQEQLAS